VQKSASEHHNIYETDSSQGPYKFVYYLSNC